MDIEFHYWMTGLIALRSGFAEDEARRIAYASQYVDDNDVCLEIKSRKDEKDTYRNYISQTMNILKPKRELMRIYPIFHFVPGDPMAETARRRDGKMHLLITTPNGPLANELLDAALAAPEDSRPYRIGIATHAFVDTWAHQNFVGVFDYFNNIGLDPKPDVGHANAEHHPDWVGHRWDDSRLVDSEVNNRSRFLEASHALFFKYCESHKARGGEDLSSEWPALQADLVRLQGPTYTGGHNKHEEARLAEYEQQLPGLGAFDEKAWFKAAIDVNVRGLTDSDDGLFSGLFVLKDEYFWRDGIDRTEMDWYRFQESVKEHQARALVGLAPVFKKMGIDIKSQSNF